VGNPASTKYTETEKVGAGLNFERKSNQLDLFEANLVKSFETSLVVERPSPAPRWREPSEARRRWSLDGVPTEAPVKFQNSSPNPRIKQEPYDLLLLKKANNLKDQNSRRETQ